MKSSKKRCSRTLITLVLIISMLIQAVAFRCDKANATSTYTIEIVNSKLEVFPITMFNATAGSYLLSYTSKLPKAPDGYYRWWYDKSTGQQIVSTTKVTKSMTIYPVDKPNSTTIVFVTNEKGDGKGTIKTEIAKTGMTLSKVIKDPKTTGKVFLGWSAKPDGSSGVFKPEHQLTINNSIPSKLYGIWFDTHDKWTEYKKNIIYLVSPQEYYDIVKSERAVLDYKKEHTKIEKTPLQKWLELKSMEVNLVVTIGAYYATGGLAAAFEAAGNVIGMTQFGWEAYCEKREIEIINGIYANREKRVSIMESLATKYKNADYQKLIKISVDTYWMGLEALSRNDLLFYGKLKEKITAVNGIAVR